MKLDMSTAVLSSVDEVDGMPALCFGLLADDATKVRHFVMAGPRPKHCRSISC